MIERVARALCKLDGHPENTQYEGKPMWESYREQAVAITAIVLSGLREPTAEMLEAVRPLPAHLIAERPGNEDFANQMRAATRADQVAVRSDWQTMIVAAIAALAPPPQDR